MSTIINDRPKFDDTKLSVKITYKVSLWQRNFRASSIVIYHGSRKTAYADSEKLLPDPEKYDFADTGKGLAWNASQALWLCINDLALQRLYSVDGFSFAGHYAIACVGHQIVILDGFASTESSFWQYVKQNAQAFFYINIPDFLIK